MVDQPHSLSTGAISLGSVHSHLPKLPALCHTIPSAPTHQSIYLSYVHSAWHSTGHWEKDQCNGTSHLSPAPGLQPSRQKPCLPQTFFWDPPLPPPAVSSPSLLGVCTFLITASSEHLLCARQPSGQKPCPAPQEGVAYPGISITALTLLPGPGPDTCRLSLASLTQQPREVGEITIPLL